MKGGGALLSGSFFVWRRRIGIGVRWRRRRENIFPPGAELFGWVPLFGFWSEEEEEARQKKQQLLLHSPKMAVVDPFIFPPSSHAFLVLGM